MIWILAPLSDSRFAQNVWDNYERQTAECRLVVVCNAGGEYSLDADAVLSSEPGKLHAMAVGMQYIREHGEPEDTVVQIDQDDWYGPSSGLAKAQALKDTGADVVGAPFTWIRFTDGTLGHFSGPIERGTDNDPFVTWDGGLAWTVAGYGEHFHVNHGGESYLGDGQNWLEDMMKAGKKYVMCDGFPDVYVRIADARQFGQKEKRRMVHYLPGEFTDHGSAPNDVAEEHWAGNRQSASVGRA